MHGVTQEKWGGTLHGANVHIHISPAKAPLHAKALLGLHYCA